MSMGAEKPPAQTHGGYDEHNFATAQEAIPLPWFCGWARLEAHWLTGKHRVRTRDPGRTKGEHFFANIIAAFSQGPVDRIQLAFWNGEPGGGIHDLAFTGRYHDSQAGEWWTNGDRVNFGESPMVRIHRGAADAAPSDRLFVAGEISGEDHPPYRRVFHAEFRQLFIGLNNSKRLPNFEVVAGRKPVVPAALAAAGAPPATLHPHGVNAILALVDILYDTTGGFGWSDDRFDWDNLAALSVELDDPRYYISPVIRDLRREEQVIADFLQYFDGYRIRRSGRLALGRIPEDGIAIEEGSITELSHHDYSAPPRLKRSAPGETLNELTIVSTEAAHWRMKEVGQTFTAPYHRAVRGTPKRETIQRPWFLQRDLSGGYGKRYLQYKTATSVSGDLRVRRSRAVNPDGTELMPGDLVQVDYTPMALDVVMRVVGRREGFASGEVRLTVESERGQFPLPYVAPSDPVPDLTPPPVEPIQRAAIIELPLGLTERRVAVAAMYARPSGQNAGASVHFSSDGTSYEEIGEATRAIAADLGAPIDAAASLISVQVEAQTDLELLRTVEADARDDDRVLLFIGGEVMSVATVSPIGNGTYSVGVLRGRAGSVPKSHGIPSEIWIVPRADLQILRHSAFAPQAMVSFKLQPRNPWSVLDLADSSIAPLQVVFSLLRPAIVWTPERTVEDEQAYLAGSYVVGTPAIVKISLTRGKAAILQTQVVLGFSDAAPDLEGETWSTRVLHEAVVPGAGHGEEIELLFTPERSGWHVLRLHVADERGWQLGGITQDAWFLVASVPLTVTVDPVPSPVIVTTAITPKGKILNPANQPICFWMVLYNTSGEEVLAYGTSSAAEINVSGTVELTVVAPAQAVVLWVAPDWPGAPLTSALTTFDVVAPSSATVQISHWTGHPANPPILRVGRRLTVVADITAGHLPITDILAELVRPAQGDPAEPEEHFPECNRLMQVASVTQYQLRYSAKLPTRTGHFQVRIWVRDTVGEWYAFGRYAGYAQFALEITDETPVVQWVNKPLSAVLGIPVDVAFDAVTYPGAVWSLWVYDDGDPVQIASGILGDQAESIDGPRSFRVRTALDLATSLTSPQAAVDVALRVASAERGGGAVIEQWAMSVADPDDIFISFVSGPTAVFATGGYPYVVRYHAPQGLVGVRIELVHESGRAGVVLTRDFGGDTNAIDIPVVVEFPESGGYVLRAYAADLRYQVDRYADLSITAKHYPKIGRLTESASEFDVVRNELLPAKIVISAQDVVCDNPTFIWEHSPADPEGGAPDNWVVISGETSSALERTHAQLLSDETWYRVTVRNAANPSQEFAEGPRWVSLRRIRRAVVWTSAAAPNPAFYRSAWEGGVTGWWLPTALNVSAVEMDGIVGAHFQGANAWPGTNPNFVMAAPMYLDPAKRWLVVVRLRIGAGNALITRIRFGLRNDTAGQFLTAAYHDAPLLFGSPGNQMFTSFPPTGEWLRISALYGPGGWSSDDQMRIWLYGTTDNGSQNPGGPVPVTDWYDVQFVSVSDYDSVHPLTDGQLWQPSGSPAQPAYLWESERMLWKQVDKQVEAERLASGALSAQIVMTDDAVLRSSEAVSESVGEGVFLANGYFRVGAPGTEVLRHDPAADPGEQLQFLAGSAQAQVDLRANHIALGDWFRVRYMSAWHGRSLGTLQLLGDGLSMEDSLILGGAFPGESGFRARYNADLSDPDDPGDESVFIRPYGIELHSVWNGAASLYLHDGALVSGAMTLVPGGALNMDRIADAVLLAGTGGSPTDATLRDYPIALNRSLCVEVLAMRKVTGNSFTAVRAYRALYTRGTGGASLVGSEALGTLLGDSSGNPSLSFGVSGNNMRIVAPRVTVNSLLQYYAQIIIIQNP